MKHIMISIKPEWVAKILNGDKTLEIRKSVPKEVLNGEECIVEIYCTKDQNKILAGTPLVDGSWKCWNRKDWNKQQRKDCGLGKYNGKVVARWHLNKADKIEICDPDILRNGKQCPSYYFEDYACLSSSALMEYIGCGYDNGWTKEWAKGYAWHIDNLEIYDKPKELSEFGLKRPFQSWGYLKDE